MKLREFEGMEFKAKFVEGTQASAYMETGELDKGVKIEDIICFNLTREDFLSEINEMCNTNYNLDSDVEPMNIHIIDEDLTSGFTDGNHEGYNEVTFLINNVNIHCEVPLSPSDFKSNLLAKAGYISIFEGTGQIKLVID